MLRPHHEPVLHCTLQLCTVCTVQYRLNGLFLSNESGLAGRRDSNTCYKGQGWGECRAYKFGNTWYSTAPLYC